MSKRVGSIQDPALYKVLAFLGWLAQENDEESEHRRATLEHVLKQSKWMPADKVIPSRKDAVGRAALLWTDPWQPEQDTAGTKTWYRQRRGLAYHDSLI